MKFDPSSYTIAELKNKLLKIEVTDEIINRLLSDSRKGVNKLARKYRKKKEKQKQIKKRWDEMNKLKKDLLYKGYELICGLDEAGRGPLAGPVVAAAVILNESNKILGLKDSKKLSPAVRKKLKKEIKEKSIAVGIGIVDNKEIDRINIHQASLKAMKKALYNLNYLPDYLLIDGNISLKEINIPQKSIVSGDSKSNSIAAASIIAKVKRDNILDKFHNKYPRYGFINHKGYGTKSHIKALEKYGPTPIHRYSYKIVKKYAGEETKE
ncbi:MAG: ribonuclease HII [Halanaerobiales bacterium]